ncbi:hypothetical protein V6N00_10720 [Tersicoccus sp. MR15.9]|uniref:hypothetical protein n=1 Tax=Tersicoccus mangrovi TaxID=3121635 RepID=UPI002FE5424F
MPTNDPSQLVALMRLILERADTPVGDRDAVVDEIRKAAGGRSDLLGEAAGRYRAAMVDPPSIECLSATRALWLCVDAGADIDVARAATPVHAARLAA